MTTSLLQPVFGGAPFSSSLRHSRHAIHTAWGTQRWASSDVVLGEGRLGVELLLRSELHNLLLALQGATELRPESELKLQVAMVKSHELARVCERELAAQNGADDGSSYASQRWLQQLQDFLVALQHDLQQARQAVDTGLLHAERELQLLLRAAYAKLELSVGATQHAHDQQQQQADSNDSSCSSSVCGSSCTTGSSVGGASSGRGGGVPRLVALRSKLSYTSHWALKVAL